MSPPTSFYSIHYVQHHNFSAAACSSLPFSLGNRSALHFLARHLPYTKKSNRSNFSRSELLDSKKTASAAALQYLQPKQPDSTMRYCTNCRQLICRAIRWVMMRCHRHQRSSRPVPETCHPPLWPLRRSGSPVEDECACTAQAKTHTNLHTKHTAKMSSKTKGRGRIKTPRYLVIRQNNNGTCTHILYRIILSAHIGC